MSDVPNLGDGLKNIFLAGIGALSIGADKSKELIDQLVSRGEITADQGKDLVTEWSQKANDAASDVHDNLLANYINSMSKEDRAKFSDKVTKFVQAANDKDDAADEKAAAIDDAGAAFSDDDAEVEVEEVDEIDVVEEADDTGNADNA